MLIALGGGEYREGGLGAFGYIDEEMETGQLGDEGTCVCVCYGGSVAWGECGVCVWGGVHVWEERGMGCVCVWGDVTVGK